MLTDPGAVPWQADVVLLAVKAHQTEGAAPFLHALCGPETIVVVLQNGVEHRALVAPHAQGATIVPAIVLIATEAIGPGHVRVHKRARRVMLPDEPAAHEVAAVFDVAEVVGDFVTEVWRKLVTNAVAGLMVLVLLPGPRSSAATTSRRSPARSRWRRSPSRGRRAPTCRTRPRTRSRRLVRGPATDAGTSILVDREAGRALEWDARNGVVVRLGAARHPDAGVRRHRPAAGRRERLRAAPRR